MLSIIILLASIRLYLLVKTTRDKWQQDRFTQLSGSSMMIRHLRPDVTHEDVLAFAESCAGLGSVAPNGVVIHYHCRALLLELATMGRKVSDVTEPVSGREVSDVTTNT